jgi:hypothetical protein
MEIAAYVVELNAGGTCVINPNLRDREYVDDYAAKHHGVVRIAVFLDDALDAVKEAKGEYERAVAV